jgi:protein-S-isoprenylcysteine O-methyltransferase Ste14
MYLGFVLILTGMAVLLKSLTPWLAVVAFFILIKQRFIRVEESMLAARFGQKFEEYQRKTRR